MLEHLLPLSPSLTTPFLQRAVYAMNNATQLAIASKVEASISGEHQQTSHIPPTNVILRNEKRSTETPQVCCSPCGFSIIASSHPLCIRDCSSSQRVDTVSPCFRKSYEQKYRRS
ncbi:hypothetical protein EYF80_017349 [Liparis tanakae]|uniref:Uncharacterized protein n=1 Tax=Liparis tanakae TaxID=230148 RepID=A0A4Z2I5C8_9TELE|nr:hypothetical protein EYF80_017349 [Liparis tanakae]